MGTKQEYLLQIPFDYIIGFSQGTRVIRHNIYYTKKDFVHHLLRNMKLNECKQLSIFYDLDVPYKEAVEWFLRNNPTGNVMSNAFLNHLKYTTEDIGKLMFEFPICNTRVDILILNKFSCSYEVKSNRDKIDRLSFQIPALKKVFEKVSLVVSSEHINKIRSNIDENIGLYKSHLKDDTIIFEMEKESELLDEYDPNSQMQLCRMIEIKKIYNSLFKTEPKNMVKKEIIKHIIKNIDKHEINEIFKNTLKNRTIPQTRTSILINNIK